jgi:hypothetical protein
MRLSGPDDAATLARVKKELAAEVRRYAPRSQPIARVMARIVLVRVAWQISSRTTREATVTRCCSALTLAHLLLPPSVRGDALDESIDEIETAAETGRPVVRRTISILVRTLPLLAVTSRVSTHARRERG